MRTATLRETSLCRSRSQSPVGNGITHIVLTTMEFIQRLAALVPRPRLHLIWIQGVLAPNAQLRSPVVPVPLQMTTAGEGDSGHEHGKPIRMTWARLLKRVFDHLTPWWSGDTLVVMQKCGLKLLYLVRSFPKMENSYG